MKKETLIAILGEVLDEVRFMETDVAFENGDGHEHNITSAKLATIIKIAERETIEDSPKNDLKAVSSDFVASDDKLPNRDDNGSEKANYEAVLIDTKLLGGEELFAIPYYPGDPIWCFDFKIENSPDGHMFVGTESMFKEFERKCREIGINFRGVGQRPALGSHIETFMKELEEQKTDDGIMANRRKNK